MEALILAAGKGERLNEITKDSPKALAKVAGLSLLCRTLRSLKEVGITCAHVVIGYRGDEIVRKFGKEYDGLPIRYIQNPNWEKGNLYSLLAAKGYLKSNFLLLMSDHLFDSRIMKHLAEQKLEGSLILAVDRGRSSPDDTKVLERNGRIISIGKKLKRFNFIDIGIFLCSPKVFHYAEEAAKNGGGELANCVECAASKGDAHIFDIAKIPSYVPKMRREVKPFWLDVDTPQDLKRAKYSLVQHSSKEASDFLAHYIHRPIENKIVYRLSDTKVTPNQLTVVVNIVAYCATALFFFGHLLIASLLTFVVGLMDGLDGKLARVRNGSTKLGTMEHPFDLLFEFSWLAALGFYLSNTMGDPLPLSFSVLAIIFIAFYRQVYDRFGHTMGKSLDDSGDFERRFKRIAGRRNLYNIHILVWVLAGLPFYCLITILGHAVLTAGVYTLRACTHMRAADKKISLFSRR